MDRAELLSLSIKNVATQIDETLFLPCAVFFF